MGKHVLSDQTGFLSGQNLSVAGQMTCLVTKNYLQACVNLVAFDLFLSIQNSTAELKVEKDLPDSNTSSSTLLLDTTDEHRIHLFDLNCRICTGKMAPPGEPPRRETPAPLVSTTSM